MAQSILNPPSTTPRSLFCGGLRAQSPQNLIEFTVTFYCNTSQFSMGPHGSMWTCQQRRNPSLRVRYNLDTVGVTGSNPVSRILVCLLPKLPGGAPRHSQHEPPRQSVRQRPRRELRRYAQNRMLWASPEPKPPPRPLFFDFIESFYNRRRRHRAIDQRSTLEFEHGLQWSRLTRQAETNTHDNSTVSRVGGFNGAA